jgi:hypothetical protein
LNTEKSDHNRLLARIAEMGRAAGTVIDGAITAGDAM